MILNENNLYRNYRQEGLSVCRLRDLKRAWGTRTPIPLPLSRNKRWYLNFLSDTFVAFQKFGI
jgi:putative transposase